MSSLSLEKHFGLMDDKSQEFIEHLDTSSLENLKSPLHFSTPKSKLVLDKTVSCNNFRYRGFTSSLYTWLTEIRSTYCAESMNTLYNKCISKKTMKINGKTMKSRELYMNKNTDYISFKYSISAEFDKHLSLKNDDSIEASW
ncbi:hypothetical protein O3M35_004657 [Rhynocoris fuscipes]|uniref:Uncharacterized protein n=1 Tax=Rhynocoris fuscipes TaxID=488301 RepID=A0AAW1CGE8_9HEMI